ncbi:cation-translocating P-type ATPase [Thiospirochaeta perfilievii]|uniref:P-type Zn(2+) transporter n=2 Tax=Thiospirochaeta perfilievii TaxID=252967 RepID=A0A5C1Q8A2_9SPIO|nr:cation-translocating P-type ATPase [Thiospirochaeta perfilievii]
MMNKIKRYSIQEMDCPTEEAMIRNKLEKLDGVESLGFNLIKRVLTVEHSLDDIGILKYSINELGFDAIDLDDDIIEKKKQSIYRSWGPIIFALLLAILSEVSEILELFHPYLPALLALGAVIISGVTTYKKGLLAITSGNLNINALMSIAVTGALIIGVWPEAAMVMVLFTISEKIEGLSLDKARNAISSLMNLSPNKTVVIQADGVLLEVDSTVVEVGQVIRVRPGELISHDGLVCRGSSYIDQSAITGESTPVEKLIGAEVFAGTINKNSEIDIEVTADKSHSTLSRIIQLVEEAQSHRSVTQRFVDKFAKYYTPIIMGISLLIAILPPIILAEPWLVWIYRALVLLIIGCPCALVVSTPVTIVSGLAMASRLGVIVKGGVYLEQAAKIDYIALDKTGTITKGDTALVDQIVIGREENILDIGILLARSSNHPISQAITRGYTKDFKEIEGEVSEFSATPGMGVHGVINGKTYYLGNQRFIEKYGKSNARLEETVNKLEEEGKTVTILFNDIEALAIFGVSDTIKESSREAISYLHKLGIKSTILSGDNLRTVRYIGLQAGVDDYKGGLLPEDKTSIINELKQTNSVVAMTGDGINDAPALANAHIGIAMGGIGTDIAIETADIIIMDDDIRKVPQLILLSKKTREILVQNIVIALGIKMIFLLLTILGFGTMWMAVFADMGASLIVVFNGMRLLRWKSKKTRRE